MPIGTAIGAETPASRACIAQMLYDSLEVPVVEQDELTSKTILTDYLGYTKITGRVVSDGVTCLNTPDSIIRANEVQLDNGLAFNDPSYEVKTYRTDDVELKNYMGYELEYYYKDTGSSVRDLGFYVLSDAVTLKLTEAMIDGGSSDAKQLRYYKTEQDTSVSTAAIDDDNIVIYNGKLLGATAATSKFNIGLIPQIGSMELIDSDADGKYDVIKIEDYTIYYVSSKVSAEYAIIDNVTKTDANTKKLILDEDDPTYETVIVNASGAKIDYNAIGTGNVLCVAVSKNTNGGEVLRKVVVVNDSVKGTVTGTRGSDVLIINGTEYNVSKAAPWFSGIGDTPALQDTGVFCKDINGDIVVYQKDATTENISYGYIMNYRDIGTFGEEKELNILTGNGSVVVVRIQDKVRINNDPTNYSAAEAITKLEETAAVQNKDDNTGVSIHQLIKFTTRVSGGNVVLDKIYTATETTKGETIESDKLYFYKPIDGSMEMTYNRTAQKLVHTSGASINIGSVGTVLVVPKNRTVRAEYKKSSVSALLRDGDKVYVELFDVSTTNTPKVLICYGKSASSAANSATPLSVVSKGVSSQINPSNQEIMSYVEGHKVIYGNNKSTFAEWVAPSSPYQPVLGDIFRAGTDDDGFASIKTEHVVYSYQNDIEHYGTKVEPGTNFHDSEYSVLMGSVIAVEDNTVMILPEKVGANATPVKSLDQAMTFNISAFSPAQILLYDVDKNGDLSVTATSEYQGVIAGLIPYDAETQLTNPSKVVLYMVHGQIVMFAVLDDAE